MADDKDAPDTKSETSMISQALNQAGSAFGGTVGSTLKEDILKGLFGTPLPHFCLRYFFTSNVLPARKIILLAGEQGVGKTSMMLEFLRIISSYAHRTYGSSMVMGIHSEEKWPDTLPPSIMGELAEGLRIDSADNAQEWMTKLMVMLNGNPKGGWGGFKREPLNSFPTAMFVDSIHGAQGAERSKKIKKEGAPTRDFSELARITTDWFPDFTNCLSLSAAHMFFILHLKPKQEGGWNTAGGKAKDFFASYTIYMTSPKKKVKPTKEGEIGFWMSLKKDSYGPGGVAMPMTMKWDFNELGMQRTWFDWEACTCAMFDAWMGNGEYKLPAKSPVREHLDGFDKKSAGNQGLEYNLPAITGDEYLSPVDFNAALEASGEYKVQLDELFHITQRLSTHEYFERQRLEAAEVAKAKRRGKRKPKAEAPKDQAVGKPVGETDESGSK